MLRARTAAIVVESALLDLVSVFTQMFKHPLLAARKPTAIGSMVVP
jgi:hypothetical protein